MQSLKKELLSGGKEMKRETEFAPFAAAEGTKEDKTSLLKKLILSTAMWHCWKRNEAGDRLESSTSR